MKRIILTSILLLCAVAPTLAQRMGVWGVAFYNLENLFDYEDDPNNKGDDEYLPTGPYKWTQEKYQQKLNNMARVIGDLARPTCPGGPAVIGISEVENERVVRDLVNTSPAKEMNLKYVHYDSPDRRGIDVALIYNPRLFRYTKSSTHPLIIPDNPNFKTRDQLLVEGTMAGEHVCILVNHWPSRYGGAKSSPLREAAAALSKHIADSVRTANPSAKVIIMGDLNDDPKDASVAKVLGATRHKKDTPADGYFNATWGLYDKGIGTLCYQDSWCLYDQQILSANLLGKPTNGLSYWKTEVFNRDYLVTPDGKKKGYPLRAFNGNIWQNGYSDHFPTITYYVKQLK